MAQVRLVLDGAEMASLMAGPLGPVNRLLLTRGERFRQAARRQARGKYGSEGNRTGCLEKVIVKRIEPNGAGIQLRVTADTSPCSPTHTSYALFVHEGTKPHDITARNAGSLYFFWPHGPDGPNFYAFRTVHHPGTKPNKFFTDNLGEFAI